MKNMKLLKNHIMNGKLKIGMILQKKIIVLYTILVVINGIIKIMF